ncbi:hypothetical protein HAX54_023323, partial [Datura stramonium]|nr:hypothetical protein [Datura stramonium]
SSTSKFKLSNTYPTPVQDLEKKHIVELKVFEEVHTLSKSVRKEDREETLKSLTQREYEAMQTRRSDLELTLEELPSSSKEDLLESSEEDKHENESDVNPPTALPSGDQLTFSTSVGLATPIP